jgi:hypothetical protein
MASPRSLCVMHEHVNYFGTKSLNALMNASGWNVIAAGDYRWQGPIGGDTMGWCLAAAA